MALHLGQLIYTSFAGVGFRTLASAEVPPEIQQAFQQQVVYQYWDAYQPPDAAYRAAYLYQVSPEQTLFGWLYNDGVDDLGRSHIPYFICYYWVGPLQSTQLDSILTCLQAGPTTVISRQSLPDSLEGVTFSDSWSHQAIYPGVVITANVRQQVHLTVERAIRLDLLIPIDPAQIEERIEAAHLLQDLSPTEAVLATCNGGNGMTSCLCRAPANRAPVKGGLAPSKTASNTASHPLQSALAIGQPRIDSVDDYRQMLLAKAQSDDRQQRGRQTPVFFAAKPLGPVLAISASLVSLTTLMLGGFYGLRVHPLASIAPPLSQAIPSQNAAVDFTPWAAANTLAEHTDSVWSLALSPDGQTLVSSSGDNTIKIWRIETGQVLHTLSGHTDTVRAIALSADGRTLASASGDHTIKLWNIETGQLNHTLVGHLGPVWSIAISADGQTLVSGGEDGTLKIWRLQTGELLHTIPAHSGRVFSVAIAPNGDTVATGGLDTTIKLWRLQTGELLGAMAAHSSAVRALAFSPDGQRLASGSWDTTIKLWNWRTRELIHTLAGHTLRVVTVAFSPNGKTLASGGIDQTLRLWGVRQGDLRQTLTGHSDWILAIATDSARLVSGSKDNTIKVWRHSEQ